MKRSAPPRRTRLRAVSKKRTSKSALTKLARRLVVELRDQGTCQRCGNRAEDGKKIDWAHVKAGRALSLTYVPWAALALCTGCHFWFDGNGNGKPETLSRRWWAEKFPERDLYLRQWEQQRSRPKFDPDLTALWLRQEIAKLEAA